MKKQRITSPRRAPQRVRYSKRTGGRFLRGVRALGRAERLRLRKRSARVAHKVYLTGSRRLGPTATQPMLFSRKVNFWSDGGVLSRGVTASSTATTRSTLTGTSPERSSLGTSAKRTSGLKVRLGLAGMLSNSTSFQQYRDLRNARYRLVEVNATMRTRVWRKKIVSGTGRGRYRKIVKKRSARGLLSGSLARLRRRFVFQKLLLAQVRRLRHREYGLFRANSKLFQKFIYHYVFKVRLAQGSFTKQPSVDHFGQRQISTRPSLRHFRLNYLRGRRLAGLVQTARTRQKMALRRAIIFVRNKDYIYERWASITREYSSFGYFRKQRLVEKRRRLLKQNKPKPTLPKVTNPVLGKYWSAQQLKLQHLIYRKSRALLQTDTIVPFFYWSLVSKFYYVTRFNRRVSEKRIRVPSAAGRTALREVMPKIKYLRTVLKNEMRILRQKLPRLYPSYLFKKK